MDRSPQSDESEEKYRQKLQQLKSKRAKYLEERLQGDIPEEEKTVVANLWLLPGGCIEEKKVYSVKTGINVVGKSGEFNDIRLDVYGISSVHAIIEVSPDGKEHFVEDLASTNGSTVGEGCFRLKPFRLYQLTNNKALSFEPVSCTYEILNPVDLGDDATFKSSNSVKGLVETQVASVGIPPTLPLQYDIDDIASQNENNSDILEIAQANDGHNSSCASNLSSPIKIKGNFEKGLDEIKASFGNEVDNEPPSPSNTDDPEGVDVIEVKKGTGASKKRKLSPNQSKKNSRLNDGIDCLEETSISRKLSEKNLSQVRILFTGLVVNKSQSDDITKLGGALCNDTKSSTHLVTDRVKRTVKFLCALALGKYIVHLDWLVASKKALCFLNAEDYILNDPKAEEAFNFNLKDSLSKAKKLSGKLFKGIEFYSTPSVRPPLPELKEIISSAGGKMLSSLNTSHHKNKKRPVVIGCPEDYNEIKELSEKGFSIYSNELVLTGILRMEVNYDEFIIR